MGRPLEKQWTVSEVVVLTRAGPEPRRQCRDKADRAAGFSGGRRYSGCTRQAGKQRPKAKKEQALGYLKDVKHGMGKVRGIWCPKTWVQVSAHLIDKWCSLSNIP